MAGKTIPLFTHGIDQEKFNKLCEGMQRISGDWIQCFSLSEALGEFPSTDCCITTGIDASNMAKELGFERIYKIPSVDLFVDEPDHPGLGKKVVKYLKYVIAVEIESSTTSPSMGPSTAQTTSPSVDEDAPTIDPRDSGFKLPKEGLSMEEIRDLFQAQYSQEEPFVFTSGYTEIAIYPDDPPGKRPIEFSLNEFYTVLKLVEITKAKGIVWREMKDASPK